jgi:hypothetical protein
VGVFFGSEYPAVDQRVAECVCVQGREQRVLGGGRLTAEFPPLGEVPRSPPGLPAPAPGLDSS